MLILINRSYLAAAVLHTEIKDIREYRQSVAVKSGMLCATEGYRMFTAPLDLPEDAPANFECVIPAAAVRAILAETRGCGRTGLWVILDTDACTLTGSNKQGDDERIFYSPSEITYPDVMQVMNRVQGLKRTNMLNVHMDHLTIAKKSFDLLGENMVVTYHDTGVWRCVPVVGMGAVKPTPHSQHSHGPQIVISTRCL